VRYLLTAAILVLTANTYAAIPVEVGDITFLQIHKKPDSTTSASQRFIVKLSGTASENSCGNDQWTGYLDDDAGKAQYSALMSALVAGRAVRFEGTAPDRCESGSLLLRNVYMVW
jgi:hypothetical protein